jgi:hypothetical protein
MEDDVEGLVRDSLRRTLTGCEGDVSAVLAEFGWHDLAYTDDALAFTVLFEEQGYLAAETNALDVASATTLALTARAPVLWPVSSIAEELGGSGVVLVDGISLTSWDEPATVLAPVAGRMQMLEVSSVEQRPLGGMACGSAWTRTRVWGTPTGDFGPWSDVEWRARLAIASELVGMAHRIIDLAVEQVSARRQFGRSIASNQAVRFRLAEAHVEMVGARALIAAAWQDRSPAAAGWAKTVAGSAHDTVAKHAIQVCGAVGLSDEHPLPALVRRGIVLDALLGAASQQQARIGREFMADQRDSALGSEPEPALSVGCF